MGIAGDLVLIILAALLGAAVARAFRQPLIIGYIGAGILVGPHTGGYTVDRLHDIEKLAEIGVALLLFALGLEFSFSELRRLWKISLLGTPLQILFVGFGGYGIASYLNYPLTASIWFGAIVSLSSTVVVIKSLTENDLLNSVAGRVMLGMLIAQDLALVPMLLVLPQITADEVQILAVVWSMCKSVLVLGAMYVVGTKVLPKLFGFVAAYKTRELLFLLTLALALGLGYLTYSFGMSFALGAFVAGILLSETDFSGQALSDISGLRDLFGLLFFVSVGMLFDPSFFQENWGIVAAVVIAIFVWKALVTSVIVRAFGYDTQIALRTGFGIAQMGEFAFVITLVGFRAGYVPADLNAIVISATVLSMVATPFLVTYMPRIEKLFLGDSASRTDDISSLPELNDHVVIIGAGTVGSYVARVLEALEVPCIMVESEYRIASLLRAEDMRVIFGDGTRRVLLESAGIDRAKLVIVAMPSQAGVGTLLQELQELRPGVPTVVRVDDEIPPEEFERFNLREVVQPKHEAALEMVRQALLSLGFPESGVIGVLSSLRFRHYNVNADPLDGVSKILNFSRHLELRWIEIQAGHEFLGKNLKDLKFRERFGVSAVAVVRGNDVISNPGPDISLQSGDLLGVIGTSLQLIKLSELSSSSEV